MPPTKASLIVRSGGVVREDLGKIQDSLCAFAYVKGYVFFQLYRHSVFL